MKKNLTIKETFVAAVKNHKNNNLKVAEKLHKEILKINPNHLNSIYLLGSLSAQIKNFNGAKQLLQKAIRIDPNYAGAYNNLGNILKSMGKYGDAI